MVPGERWQTGLSEALDASGCVAIFFGPSGEGVWHNEEMQVALNKAVRTRDDYRVIPVLLPGGDPSQVDGFLELRTWVDFRHGLDDEPAFRRLVAAINGVAPDSADGLLELPDIPRPYRGIERFDGEQHEFFFGRDDEIGRLIERVDQFEEVFTQRSSANFDQTDWQIQTESFAANLLAAVNHRFDWLRVVVTLRADFVDRFVGSDFPDFRTLLERRQFWLGGMGDDDLREFIVRPAAKCGAYFEKGLVERLLKQMHGQASALPLLEEALNSLWDKRRGCWLTHQSLDEIGGVGGALAEKAESIFNRLSDTEQAIARRVFMKLVQLGEGTRDTRRRVAIANLQSVNDDDAKFETVLHRFSTGGSRLVTFSSEPATN